MSTLKLEHIAHIDNAGPDISIDASGHLNIVNGNLQMGGVTMLDASNGDLSTGNNASVNIRDAAGEVAGRIRNWSSPTNSIAIESDPSNSAAGSYLTFTVDGSRKMTILGNNVGIGTDSPAYALDVRDGIVFAGRAISDAGSISYTNTAAVFSSRGVDQDAPETNILRLMRDGTSGVQYAGVADFNMSEWESVGVNSRTQLTLNLGHGDLNSLQTTDVMTWRSNGNVGIGTTNPLTKLHAQVSNVPGYTSVQNDGIVIERTGGTAALNIVTDIDQTGAIWFGDATDADAGGIFYQHSADRMIFRVAAGSRVKINSQGVIEGASDAEIKTSPIRKHSNTISTNTTIDSSENAIASGPISVATGVTLTINGNMTVV